MCIAADRLKLVPVNLDYLNCIFSEFTEEVALYMAPKAFSVQDKSVTENYIRSCMLSNENNVDKHLVILDKNTDEFLGCAALLRIHRRVPEIGFWIKKSAWGHKYGAEAVRALINWAFNYKDYRYIIYPVDRDNVHSAEIARLCGGREDNDYMQTSESGRTLNVIEYHICKQKA